MIFAGIDGGQSATTAVVGDERGAVLGRAAVGPADLVGLARDAERQALAVRGALAAALADAGLPAETPVAALVAGLTGYDEGESPLPDVAACALRVRVVHDSEIAHAGALDGGPGIVIIAGTGSVAAGCAAAGEPLVRAGGWGSLLGDEGSAFWIAVRAIGSAMQRWDRNQMSPIAGLALRHFHAASLRAIQHAIAYGEIERPAMAAFARDVLAAAAAPESDAAAIVRAAAAELAALAATVDRRLPPSASPRSVSHAGGLFASDTFREYVAQALRVALPLGELRPPAQEPVIGALRLARRLGARG